MLHKETVESNILGLIKRLLKYYKLMRIFGY